MGSLNQQSTIYKDFVKEQFGNSNQPDNHAERYLRCTCLIAYQTSQPMGLRGMLQQVYAHLVRI